MNKKIVLIALLVSVVSITTGVIFAAEGRKFDDWNYTSGEGGIGCNKGGTCESDPEKATDCYAVLRKEAICVDGNDSCPGPATERIDGICIKNGNECQCYY